MLDFKKVELDDKQTIERLLDISDHEGCSYSFATMFCWQDCFNTRIAIKDDCLFLKSGSGKRQAYLFPAGDLDVKTSIGALLEDAREREIDFGIFGVTNKQKQALIENFGDIFNFEPDRDFYDYIYDKSDLASLAGKKYHAKRNHISRFERNYNWRYEEINKDNIESCFEVWRGWCEDKNCSGSGKLKKESCALGKALEHFEKLGLCGGLLFADDKPVAFCLGERQRSDTFITHYEKALPEYEGAYALINREFAKNTVGNFKYINREEDTGQEGLRKAKLSYHPAILLEKYFVTLRG